jgi:putative ABC transport system substrate-binding protein
MAYDADMAKSLEVWPPPVQRQANPICRLLPIGRGDKVRRRDFIVGVLTAAAPLGDLAQAREVRIGVLALTDADQKLFASELRAGLGELGVTEGHAFALELRSAGGSANRLLDLATELVTLKVDVLAAIFTPCALAAKQATTSIPIVMVSVGDPVGTGLVASLSRPGGNVTGLSNMAAETAGKSVELFRDMLPSVRRVAVLANPVDPFTKPFLEEVQRTGRAANVEVAPIAMVRKEDDVDEAFAAMAKAQTDAVVVQGIFFSKSIADLAIKHHLPTASVLRSYVHAGGLLSYGAHTPDIFRRSARLVHKLLMGEKPENLPVEQPTKFELAINLKTAKALGVTIPPTLLVRADEVIE